MRQEVSELHQSANGSMYDFCDGVFFKSHPIFKEHPKALQFVLYYDDIEVANPLGSKAGVHKLGELYSTVTKISID